jgi:hypothetical protein
MDELTRLSTDFSGSMNEYCTFWTLEGIVQEKANGVFKPDDPRIYEYTLQFKDESKQKDFLQIIHYLDIQIISLSKKSNK